ncbi:hypothetical protein GGR04_000988 [Aureimonas pseudogalii]|uniref:Uncharacterized protein n=1 Tax=Aureimonas pseudogalii TaxID=1744844 RepID=A0A7W6EDA4_9HYPH|nr:hypothetical protein [Aureimonas pseudogalii]
MSEEVSYLGNATQKRSDLDHIIVGSAGMSGEHQVPLR